MNDSPNTILFMTPPYHCGVVEVAGRWIPLQFVYLAAAARQAGWTPEIYDAMTKDHGLAEIEERLKTSRPKVVASSAITATVNAAVATLELAKRLDPGVVTILGGVHPTYCYEEIFDSTTAVDYVVCGEGEATVRELLAVLAAGGDPASVAGLAFRRNGETVRTGRRPFFDNLDDLPAAWDLLEWSDYRYFVIPNSRLGAVSTSRGCPHDCIFCSQQKFWEQSWRARAPGSVVDEIAMLHDRYGVNVFLISDEYPTKERERWEAILDLLIERGLPIYLLMETRAPDILRDRDILWKYRKAGVVHIYLGLEATDQKTLDYIRKELDVDEGKVALDLIHEQGIVTETSFVLGFPEETRTSIQRTLKLAQYYNPDNAHFLAITPWPYADLHREVEPYIRVRDYGRYNLIDPIIEPKRMTLEDVDFAIIECYRKFYFRKVKEVLTLPDPFKRDYLLRAMKLIMGSSFIIKKLGVGTLKSMPRKVEELIARMVS